MSVEILTELEKTLQSENAQLHTELEATKAELEKAKACCAEMRQFLIDDCEPTIFSLNWGAKRDKLVSSTCGSELLAELQRYRELPAWLDQNIAECKEACKKATPFDFECGSDLAAYYAVKNFLKTYER